ncbi:hypothetical protein [Riemerella columbina]|uniref:hypothetical protein n=1 Tax=Riemerella columbina TaxID=103810 RepID=UPI00036E3D71|nr:hypothetical protein [Riemerella columbina]
MKKILRYDNQIQQVLIGLIPLLWILASYFGEIFNVFSIITFFSLAVYQYTINWVKFCNPLFKNKMYWYRIVYLVLASYVVIPFLILLISSYFNIMIEIQVIIHNMLGAWVVLTPILIFGSLFISFKDRKQFENLLTQK